MNKNQIALIHTLITGSIGVLFLAIIYVGKPITFPIALLIYPLGYGIIRLFMKTGVRNAGLGFLIGGVFANIGWTLLLFLMLSFSAAGGDGIGLVILFFGWPAVFIIGGIAGAIIVWELRREERKQKTKASEPERAKIEVYY